MKFEINVQLFTGSCTVPAGLNTRSIINKLNKIIKKTGIKNAIIGWNKDVDLPEITSLLRSNGADVYLWLPVFSELEALADFLPLIGFNNRKLKINYKMDSGENFVFCCPANIANTEIIINTYEKHYSKISYDGIFLDKIRFPSFIGGMDSVLGCFCNYCRSVYDLPEIDELQSCGSNNPLGIISYNNLQYSMNSIFKKLFDYKCDAVFNSLERLCKYFRGRGLKTGLDLFAPFLAYFVGQDYHRLAALADFIKPMFYSMTNAPAGLPFEINMYAKAFDNDIDNIEKRREMLLDCIGYENDFIAGEISGVNKIIYANKLNTKLYAGIEINYNEGIAPVTEKYIRESIASIKEADGILASWDLNTTPDSHIDCLLDAVEVFL